MYYNVHSINKLGKQNLIKYAYYNYEIVSINNYIWGLMFVIHELGWTLINW
jgi:hypothetical protein